MFTLTAISLYNVLPYNPRRTNKMPLPCCYVCRIPYSRKIHYICSLKEKNPKQINQQKNGNLKSMKELPKTTNPFEETLECHFSTKRESFENL